jgi:hypothetical protein
LECNFSWEIFGMADDDHKTKKTLTDSDITTDRRGFLGLVTVGSAMTAAAALTGGQAQAQAADVDNGNWTDLASCPRGRPGIYSGWTDSDSGGAIVDQGGYGRGAPYC